MIKTEYNEVNARELMRLMSQRLEKLGVLIDRDGIDGGQTSLDKMLAHGNYPETESAALKAAFAALEDAVSDMEQALLMPFDMARADAEFYANRARELGCAPE
jgi:hypothetical protein